MNSKTPFLALALMLGACGGGDEPACEPKDKIDAWIDEDGDGFGDDSQPGKVCSLKEGQARRPGDCDDADPAANPWATEVCDGIDNDCDGRVDEYFVQNPFFVDSDGDGYGDPTGPIVYACVAPAGTTRFGGDCDDTSADINPGALEICNTVDDDCDGLVDHDDPTVDVSGLATFYRDADGDGFGDPLSTLAACTPPSGMVSNQDDCDDTNVDVNPLGVEVCNTLDDDCNGLRDDYDPGVDPTSFRDWYADADGDGLGDAAVTAQACAQPTGHVDNDLDCDDTDSGILGPTDWLPDGDGDGFGVLPAAYTQCTAPDPYHADRANGLDCDDTDAAVYPFAPEICNTVDDDCNGMADDADPNTDVVGTGGTFYPDLDGDGFGDPSLSFQRCNALPNQADNDLDCDDTDPLVNPGLDEVCNGYDDNCDGLADDADPGVDPLSLSLWYFDADADGFGDLLSAVAACDPPLDYVGNSTDCDDTDGTIGAPELWYEDLDGDGSGTASATTGPACSSPGVGWARLGPGLDCDDTDATTYPEAPEVCGDGIDQDCNGIDDCDLLFEDWETGTVDAGWWIGPTGDGGLVSTPALGDWSMNLGGGGATLETVAVDSSVCLEVEVSFEGKRGPEIPQPGDYVAVEWFDGVGWVQAFQWGGNGLEDPEFQTVQIPLTNPLALHSGFQVRFVSVGDGYTTDDFFLDDIAVTCL